MGFIMTFELKSGQEWPHWFIRTDSKHIVHWLAEGHSWRTNLPDRVGSIAEYLEVDTGPLKEIGFEDMPLEEYYAAYGNKESMKEHAREAWEYNQQRNQAA